MSLTFYTFECSKCGCVYELIGTPSPEDLNRPLCPSCERKQNEQPGSESQPETAPGTGPRSV